MADAPEITVLNGAVRLVQAPNGFRTCLDSVMLAAACPAKAGQRVLDLGCGVGGAMFSLASRVADVHVTGVELLADVAVIARDNAALNGFDGRSAVICDDICQYRVSAPDARFDHVMCNPPFMEGGKHLRSPKEGKAIAHGGAGEHVSIKHWIDCAFHNMKPGGSISVIHRADTTDKIIQAFGKRFGAVEIMPLWPKAGVDAKRVIIRARKDRKSPAILRAGVVLHRDDGTYTAEADKILRDAAPLYADAM